MFLLKCGFLCLFLTLTRDGLQCKKGLIVTQQKLYLMLQAMHIAYSCICRYAPVAPIKCDEMNAKYASHLYIAKLLIRDQENV